MTALVAVLCLVRQGAPTETVAEREKRFAQLSERVGQTYDDWFRAAGKIKTGKPVSDEQAYILANAYFTRFVSGCGCIALPSLRHSEWVFDSRVGAGGSPGPAIYVERATGFTRSPKRPTVKDPKIYLESLRGL